ncbi:MAG: ribosomal protection-like ABC-F family protein [Christensenellales bacterium]
MIILNKISKEYGDKVLFKNLNMTIYDGEKIGVVGTNGSGKSSLLSIIAGKLKADDGFVKCDDKIGYVKQASDYSEKQYFEIASNIISKIEFFKINNELNLGETFEFDEERFKNLSGGEKTKLMISSALIGSPNALVLDEPTNHLDLSGIEWLENKIIDFEGTVIVVSHDRDFLNKTVNKIWELEDGKVNEYYGNFDDYKHQKQEQILSLNKKYNEQKSLEKKLEQQIKDMKAKASLFDKKSKRDGSSDSRSIGYKNSIKSIAGKMGKIAKAKQTRLEKEKQSFVEKPKEEKEIFYRLSAKEISSKLLIKAEGIKKSFGNNILFENSSFCVENGDKIALVGDNGTGKTTLLKIILGKESFVGDLWKSQSLKIAYLSQEILNDCGENTIFDVASCFGEFKTKFLTNLANMNMNKNLFGNKIKNLSLGERMKIKINELIMSDFNMLILDEPTNHLDISNKEFLEKILSGYEGSCIIVSHDKKFLSNICTKTLEIKDKVIRKI